MLRHLILFALWQIGATACSSEKELKRSETPAPANDNDNADASANPNDKGSDGGKADSKTGPDKAASTVKNAKPNPPPPAQAGEEAAIEGELSGVSATGRVYGFAYQKDRPDESVQVSVYVDNVAGQALLTLTANLAGFDNGVAGDHGFAGDLPVSFRDGKAHKVFLVLESMTGERNITPAGFGFTAYAPKEAGKKYYEATLKPLLQNRCVSCHQVNYEVHWANLISPSPAEGGTAANNQLLRKPAALDAHGGGKLCTSATASPCAQISAWWKLEFGT